jgi:4'-phosphopantetheinyl transferase
VTSCEVDVWWLDAHGVTVAPALLDRREIARANRVRHVATRETSLAAAMLLRLAVARAAGCAPAAVLVDRTCPDCTRWHGAPRLIGLPGLEVSVSHAGHRVGVAVGRGPALGLDVEQRTALPDPGEPGLLTSVLDPLELARHPTMSRDDFGTYWVRKEAVLKATGEGLRRQMPTLRVSAPTDAPALENGPDDLPRRTAIITLLRDDEFHLAVLAALAPPRSAAPALIAVERDGRHLFG